MRTQHALTASVVTLIISRATGQCPVNVTPGMWYGDPSRVWQSGNADSRCDQSVMSVVDKENMLQCAGWEANAAPTCTYSPAGTGLLWCPLQSKADGCPAIAGVDHCLENSLCFDQGGYGVCKCTQCPCPAGRRGQNCELCDPPWCAGNCTNNDVQQPGGRFLCAFLPDFYNTLYTLIFPKKGAEPMAAFNWDNETQEANFTLFYSMCTQKEQVLATVTYKDCSLGMRAQCEAAAIPNPCLFCETFLGFYAPPSEVEFDTVNSIIETVMRGKGIYWACEGPQCTAYIEGLFSFGAMSCISGFPCSNAEEIQQSTPTTDDTTDISMVWSALAAIAAVVLVVLFFMALAYKYRFKAASGDFTIIGPLLSWTNISFSVRSHHFLQELEGRALPGSFIAVMGPVGAGKSTLLKVLAGRLEANKGGSIRSDGSECSVAQRQRLVGLVPQESSCHPLDTVEEAISFACAMGGGTFPQVGVLEGKLARTCGSLSGGQRRLVDIYVELARRPRVLLLDEPTTGLDNDAALALGQLLKEVSASIAVVATVHQPRPELAELFTEVIILKDGTLACHGGDTSAGVSAVEGVQQLITATEKGAETPRSATLDRAMDLVAAGKTLGSQKRAETNAPVAPQEGEAPSEGSPSLRATPSLPKQLLFIAIRTSKRACRRGKWSFVATLVFAIVLGLTYRNPPSDVNGARQRLAIPFVLMGYSVFQVVGATYEPTEALELAEHEVLSRVYSRGMESAIRLVGLTTEQVMHAAILAAIMYPVVGLRPEGARPVVFALCIMAVFIGSALVARVFRARSNSTSSMVRALIANGYLLLQSGLFVEADAEDFLSRATRSVSFMGSAYRIISMHELSGLQLDITLMSNRTATVLGESVLDYFALPTKVNSLPGRLVTLGWQILGWGAAAFIVLCIPPRFYSVPWWAKSLSTAPRVTVQGATKLLSASLPPPTQGSGAVGPEVEEGRGVQSELVWTSLGNPDISELSGGVRTGQLLGILGPCGSGKTTLLATLAGRIAATTGHVSMNGQKVGPWQRRGLVGYVPQQDALCPLDRVQEAVAFAATASGVASLELDSTKERLIGELSPGQRRIASVVVELARRPCVLALDEPTSGLDATSSVELMSLLKDTSKSLPVIATLHQPRPEIARLLTHVLIMAQGQVCACLPYADFEGAMQQGPNPQPRDLDATEHALSHLQELKDKKLVHAFEPTQGLSPPHARGRAGFLTLAYAVFNREFCRIYERNWSRPLRFFAAWGVVAPLLLGGTYMSADFTDDLTGIRTILGVFSAVNTIIAASTITRISEFHDTRRHCLHELESKVMSPVLHAACQTLTTWVVRLPAMGAFSIILSLFLRLQTDPAKRMIYLSTNLLTVVAMALLADAISAFTSLQSTAVNVYAGVTLIMLMAGTPLVMTDFKPDQGSAVVQDARDATWMTRLSLFTSAANAQINNEMLGRNFTNDVEVPPLDVPGEEWLGILSVSKGIGREVGIMFGWSAALWLLVVLGLLTSMWPRKRAARTGSRNPAGWLLKGLRKR